MCVWVKFYDECGVLEDVDTTCGAMIDDEVLAMAEEDFTNCPYCGDGLVIKTREQFRQEAYEDWCDSQVDMMRDEELFEGTENY